MFDLASHAGRPVRRVTRGFTLIELLVVIGIITLLVGILIPSLGAIRTKARNTATVAEFKSIETALEAYRGESSLESTYPPSRSDVIENGVSKTAAWFRTNAAVDVPTCGAVLLTYALAGADRLGTPGFRDLNRNGTWADDINSGTGGAYAKNETNSSAAPRYGTLADAKLLEQMKTFVELRRMEVLRSDPLGSPGDEALASWQPGPRQTVFIDSFDRPILYYRANPAAQNMIQPPAASGGGGGGQPSSRPGVYDQRDNALITGLDGGPTEFTGMNLGGGDLGGGRFHRIAKNTPVPPVTPAFDGDGRNTILSDTQYEDHFARYILDPSVKVNNTPVRKESYLLISAGKDGIYGTTDDITNWARQ